VKTAGTSWAAGVGRHWQASAAREFLAEVNGRPRGAPDRDQFGSQHRKFLVWALALTAVAVVVRVPLIGIAFTASDTSQYLGVARDVFHGGFPDNLRPPAYPLLLAGFELVGANPVRAVVVLQNVTGIFLPAGVLAVGWRFFSPMAGLIAGFLTAASALMIATEQLALAEYLFGVVLLIATALLVETVLRLRNGDVSWAWLAATGAAFGLATLLRANGLLAVVAIPAALLLATRAWRPALAATAVALAALAMVLAPWSIHNLVRFGDPNVSTVGNISLYARAVTWDGVPPTPNSREGRLALSIYNAGGPPTALFNALVAEGRTEGEATAAMGRLARTAIGEDPGVYVSGTWDALRQYRVLYDPGSFWANPGSDQIATTRRFFRELNLSDQARPLPRQVVATREIPGDSLATRVPWQIAQGLNRLAYLVTAAGLLVFLLPLLGSPRQRLAATTFLLVLLIGVLGASLTSVFSPRYDIMFAPLVWILLAAATVRVTEMVAAAVRCWPRWAARVE
jgi:4-amino-4-deoxy-L-arabinose transferase-like glycosyltransferase